MRKIIALVMVLSISVLSMVSCDVIGKIKDRIFGDSTEYSLYEGSLKHEECYWFDSYDELRRAVDKLEANGSNVHLSLVPNFQDEEYSVKYSLRLSKNRLKRAKNDLDPFDRKATEVHINWFVFHGEVTTEQIKAADKPFDCLQLYYNDMHDGIIDTSKLGIDYGIAEYGLDWIDDLPIPGGYALRYNGEIAKYYKFCDECEWDEESSRAFATKFLNSMTVLGSYTNDSTSEAKSGDTHDLGEVMCVDTYDEARAAIDLLESHGSKVNFSPLFAIDNKFVDTKIVFSYMHDDAEALLDGQNPFDRRIKSVGVTWYGFDRYYPTELMNDVTSFHRTYSILKCESNLGRVSIGADSIAVYYMDEIVGEDVLNVYPGEDEISNISHIIYSVMQGDKTLYTISYNQNERLDREFRVSHKAPLTHGEILEIIKSARL